MSFTLRFIKMNIQDYKKIIDETAIYPSEVSNFGIAYCFLGLIEEIYEFNNTEERHNIIKEAGDIIWYITALSKELDLDYERIMVSHWEDGLSYIGLEIASFAGNIKKYYRDGKVIEKEGLTILLEDIISSIKYSLIMIDSSFDEVLTINYNKLIKRRETNTIHGDGDNREEHA